MAHGRGTIAVTLVASVLVAVLLASCATTPDADDNAPIDPVDTTTKATVTVDESIRDAADGLTVSSASGVGTPSASGYSVPVNSKSAQLVTAVDGSGNLLGCTITTAAASASAHQVSGRMVASVSPLSTALALLFLTPGMLPTSSPTIIAEFQEAVKDLPEVQSLAAALAAQLAKDRQLDLGDAPYVSAYREAARAASVAVWGQASEAVSRAGLRPESQAGLTLVGQSETATEIKLKLQNDRARPWRLWSQTDEKWKDQGYAWFASTKNPLSLSDLIETWKKDWFWGLVGSETTEELIIPKGSAGQPTLTAYGPLPFLLILQAQGLADPTVQRMVKDRIDELVELHEEDHLDRVAGPTIIQVVFQITFPIASVLVGTSAFTPDQEIVLDAVNTFGQRFATLLAKYSGGLDASGDAWGILTDLLDWTAKAIVKEIAKNWIQAFLDQWLRPVTMVVVGINAIRMIATAAGLPVYCEFGGAARIAWCMLDNSGCTQVWMMYDGGQSPTQITSAEVQHGDPAFSPDGAKLALCMTETRLNGVMDLYVMDLSTKALTRLTYTSQLEPKFQGVYNPAWSPDGREITFVAKRLSSAGYDSWDLFKIPASGGGWTRVTDVAATHGSGGLPQSPSWGPQGIWYHLAVDAVRELYLGDDRVTSTGLAPAFPCVSADGALVLCDAGHAVRNVYRMNADGSGFVQLTEYASGSATTPEWSPDGEGIAYRYRDGVGQSIRWMPADGSAAAVELCPHIDRWISEEISYGPPGPIPQG